MSRLEELKKKNDGTKYESRLEKLKKQSRPSAAVKVLLKSLGMKTQK